MQTPHFPGRRCDGFSMVEVLVTIVIIAIGLLGLASLQLNSLRNNTTAYERTQATMLAYSIIDRMRTNRDSANAGLYNTALGTAPGGGADCTTGTCTSSIMATSDVYEWKCSLGKWDCNGFTSKLPNGDGAIAIAGGVVTVTIQWEEKRSETAAADRLTQLSVSTVL